MARALPKTCNNTNNKCPIEGFYLLVSEGYDGILLDKIKRNRDSKPHSGSQGAVASDRVNKTTNSQAVALAVLFRNEDVDAHLDATTHSTRRLYLYSSPYSRSHPACSLKRKATIHTVHCQDRASGMAARD